MGDEYAFSSQDSSVGWLRRYLERMPNDVAVVLLQNTLFGGIDAKDTNRNMSDRTHARPERFLWRTTDQAAASNGLKKYIAHATRTCSYGVHSASPCTHYRVLQEEPSILRF